METGFVYKMQEILWWVSVEREMESKMWESPARCGRLGRSVVRGFHWFELILYMWVCNQKLYKSGTSITKLAPLLAKDEESCPLSQWIQN